MTIVNVGEFMVMAKVQKSMPTLSMLAGKYRDGVTDKQKSFLRTLGIGTSQIKYKGQASFVLEIALDRKNRGLATPGQMRALKEHGLDDVHNITFRQAVQILGTAE